MLASLITDSAALLLELPNQVVVNHSCSWPNCPKTKNPHISFMVMSTGEEWHITSVATCAHPATARMKSILVAARPADRIAEETGEGHRDKQAWRGSQTGPTRAKHRVMWSFYSLLSHRSANVMAQA